MPEHTNNIPDNDAAAKAQPPSITQNKIQCSHQAQPHESFKENQMDKPQDGNEKIENLVDKLQAKPDINKDDQAGKYDQSEKDEPTGKITEEKLNDNEGEADYFIFQPQQAYIAELGAKLDESPIINSMNGNTKVNDAQLAELYKHMQDEVTQLQMMLISELAGDTIITDEEIYQQFKASDKAMHSYFSKGFLSLNKTVREGCKVEIPSLLDIYNCDDPSQICNANIQELAHELNMDLPDYAALSKLIFVQRIEAAQAHCNKPHRSFMNTDTQNNEKDVGSDLANAPQSNLTQASVSTETTKQECFQKIKIKSKHKKSPNCQSKTLKSLGVKLEKPEDNWFLHFSKQENDDQK